MLILTGQKTYNSPNDFSDAEVIGLSGLLGLHDDFSDPDIDIICYIDRAVDYIRVDITSPDIAELKLVIYPTNRSIYNESFVKRGKRTGLAASWVKSQVTFASLFSFDILQGQAFRDKSETSSNDKSESDRIRWTGYLIWAKFGYLMTEPYISKFNALLTENGKQAESLLDLISTEEGLSFWAEFGDSWEGVFNLMPPQSDSRKILRSYQPSGKMYN